MSAELQQLGRALWAAQSRRRAALDRGLATIGTTFPQWFALGEIARHPGSSAHWLAVKTFQSDQSFGTLANRLEAQGLIARSPGVDAIVAALADCAAAPALFYADWAHPIGATLGNAKAYRKRLLARPSFARAVDEARPYRSYFPLGAPDRD